jgi:hypothetical protein
LFQLPERHSTMDPWSTLSSGSPVKRMKMPKGQTSSKTFNPTTDDCVRFFTTTTVYRTLPVQELSSVRPLGFLDRLAEAS